MLLDIQRVGLDRVVQGTAVYIRVATWAGKLFIKWVHRGQEEPQECASSKEVPRERPTNSTEGRMERENKEQNIVYTPANTIFPLFIFSGLF